jgi:hypothetical protein
MGSWTVCVLIWAARPNNKLLDCRWNCGSISPQNGTQISGQLRDVRRLLWGYLVQQTVVLYSDSDCNDESRLEKKINDRCWLNDRWRPDQSSRLSVCLSPHLNAQNNSSFTVKRPLAHDLAT